MKQLTITLDDLEYTVLRSLANPDEDGKAPQYGSERGNKYFDTIIELQRKGLVTVHFTTDWDHCWCMLSPAGFFVMDWKSNHELEILDMGE